MGGGVNAVWTDDVRLHPAIDGRTLRAERLQGVGVEARGAHREGPWARARFRHASGWDVVLDLLDITREVEVDRRRSGLEGIDE